MNGHELQQFINSATKETAIRQSTIDEKNREICELMAELGKVTELNRLMRVELAHARNANENLRIRLADVEIQSAGYRQQAANQGPAIFPQPLGERPELPLSAVSVPTSPRGD